MIRRPDNRLHLDGLEELGLFNEEKGRLRGVFIAVLNYLNNCYREDKAKKCIEKGYQQQSQGGISLTYLLVFLLVLTPALQLCFFFLVYLL